MIVFYYRWRWMDHAADHNDHMMGTFNYCKIIDMNVWYIFSFPFRSIIAFLWYFFFEVVLNEKKVLRVFFAKKKNLLLCSTF